MIVIAGRINADEGNSVSKMTGERFVRSTLTRAWPWLSVETGNPAAKTGPDEVNGTGDTLSVRYPLQSAYVASWRPDCFSLATSLASSKWR